MNKYLHRYLMMSAFINTTISNIKMNNGKVISSNDNNKLRPILFTEKIMISLGAFLCGPYYLPIRTLNYINEKEILYKKLDKKDFGYIEIKPQLYHYIFI